jgi:hypothetical protein
VCKDFNFRDETTCMIHATSLVMTPSFETDFDRHADLFGTKDYKTKKWEKHKMKDVCRGKIKE